MQQNCSASDLSSNSELSNAYIGTPNTGNYSSILQLYYHGAPVAQYSTDPCMIYCNVTAPSSTQEIADCVFANVGSMKYAMATPSPTASIKSATQSPTATGKAAEEGAVRREGLDWDKRKETFHQIPSKLFAKSTKTSLTSSSYDVEAGGDRRTERCVVVGKDSSEVEHGSKIFAVLTSSTDIMARQYGFQVIIGICLGMVSTATFLLVPTKLEKRDLAVGTGMVAQFRILGGVVALAIVTCVSTPVLHSTLLSSLSQQQATSILERLAIVQSLPKETQKVVRDRFSRGFDLQMKIITGFAAAHIPAALLIISNDVASRAGKWREGREHGDSNRNNA
ncbi:hypothetical protein DM02DRAFT_652014 [Periconia macrospinosa]|uniref:Uncharacterized protein n=1 Tax=Periconia macrospinosa TaxID=97972 RepID=A0A2V1E2V7_9PLEO|nr:hypothetical protein DM02DRAFT_652014 [Periconia macrospinosa]